MLKSLLVASAVLAASMSHASTSVVFALADNYPPLMRADGGIAGQIIEEANTRLAPNFKIEIESAPWARTVSLVENGRANGLVGTYYRPDVRPWINPYSVPLLQDPVSIFCRDGVADASWEYPKDYAGLTFGFLIGSYAAGDEFAAMREAGEIAVDEGRTLETNLKKLKAGRVDCFVEGRLPIQVELAAMGGDEGVELVGDVKVEDFFVGFQSDWAQQAGSMEFIEAFNAVIEEMKADGTIKRMLADGVK